MTSAQIKKSQMDCINGSVLLEDLVRLSLVDLALEIRGGSLFCPEKFVKEFESRLGKLFFIRISD